MRLEIIYETGCAHKEDARRLVQDIIDKLAVAATVLEINKDDPNAPMHARFYASPSILVEGRDVSPDTWSGSACRIYWDEGKLSHIPPRGAIVAAMHAAVFKSNQAGTQ